MIVDGDIRESNALRDDGVLAGPRQLENRGLCLTRATECQNAESEKELKLAHWSHLDCSLKNVG
jgi:hypothetical protein